MNKVAEKYRKLAIKILSALEKGNCYWGDLLRKTFATPGIFGRVMSSLKNNGYIEKLGNSGTRTPYAITDKGRKQLEIWKSKNGC